jgi:hypothetical protein
VGAGPQTAIGILTSRSSIENLIKHFNLTERWHKNYSDTFHKVESSISINTDKDSGFVRIAFESTDKGLAVDAVRTLLAFLQAQSGTLSVNVSRQNRIFVESRLKSAQDTRQMRERVMVEATTKSPLATSQDLQKSYMEARSHLAQVEASLSGATAKISAISKSLDQLYTSNGTSESGIARGSAVSANDELATITKELATRRLLLEDAMSTYRSGAAELERAKSDYRNAQQVSISIGKSRKVGVAGRFDPALTAANSEAAELKATVDGYKRFLILLEGELRRSPVEAAFIDRMKADLLASQEQVNRLEQELALARIAEERDPSRFEVVDQAAIDPDFSSPKKGLIAAVVFAIALVLQGVPYLRKLVVFES